MTDNAQDTGPNRLPARHTLAGYAEAVVRASDPGDKVALARAAGEAWFQRRLSRSAARGRTRMPDRPGRPPKPELLPPREMPKRRGTGESMRFALLHALAHIELNAIDLAWDLIGRFIDDDLPRAFLDDWVTVGCEEAKHFRLIAERLAALGGSYGDLPAHDGLWQAAQETGHSLTARVAIVPLVLEARGLDVTPSMIEKAREIGDEETASVLEIIYRDEIGHVACGAKWFKHLCDQDRTPPEPRFHDLVRRHFRGHLKPPFNDKARSQAGLTPGFYKPLVGVGGFD